MSAWIAMMLMSATVAWSEDRSFFAIQVVDDATGRGVPLVQLQTTDKARYYTDSNGYVAFDEPGLMDQEVWFTISSHGYEFPGESFGKRGVTLKVTPGGKTQLKIRRMNLAERLYRVTGQGIYRDTVRLGIQPPIAQGLLNAKVMGQDTVQTAIYRGKLYWFWGDTDRPSSHLGNFFTSGATSGLPGQGELDPSIGVNLTYFANASFASPPVLQKPSFEGLA
ncbi:MAG TPA: hypothetical protein VHP11_08905 [Tepidisphaeraceae bacterium]|nr:hypothetical protein [Tepidisphaeraceae bacterium]